MADLDLTANGEAATIPVDFLASNLAARNNLQRGLQREQEKQESLRSEFGSDAESLFQDWRKEQEAQQLAAETKLQESQEQETNGTKIESKQES
jgi:hypothetical protein